MLMISNYKIFLLHGPMEFMIYQDTANLICDELNDYDKISQCLSPNGEHWFKSVNFALEQAKPKDSLIKDLESGKPGMLW